MLSGASPMPFPGAERTLQCLTIWLETSCLPLNIPSALQLAGSWSKHPPQLTYHCQSHLADYSMAIFAAQASSQDMAV